MARLLKAVLPLLALALLAGVPASVSARSESGGATRITVRQTVPSVSVGLSAQVQLRLNAPVSVTATFSEPVAGFALDDVAVVNGVAGNLAGSGAVYTFDVTPTVLGEVTVDIAAGAAEDAQGNPSTAAARLSLGLPYDFDGDRGISKAEAIAAVVDYFDGRITKAQAIEVILRYFASPAEPGPGEEASVSLTLEAEAQLAGYRSDGTADVAVTVSLRNVGRRPLQGVQGIGVTCRRGDVVVTECPDTITVELADGFGPGGTEFTVRAPMGSVPMAVELRADDGPSTAIEVGVPERILGVGRHIWECYGERPGHMNRCGGWHLDSQSVRKWQPGKPIRVWAEGRQDYLEAVEVILAQIAELLNHTFETAESEEQADLVVYVGTSYHPGTCSGGGGCGRGFAGPGSDQNTIVRGEVWVSDRGDAVPRWVIGHELFHALIPQGHYPSPYQWLGTVEGLSATDEAILRLHAHPLVKPGMTTRQVEELIVFDDQLLDASPGGVNTLVWRAREALIEKGTASFTSRGVCLTDTQSCRSHALEEFDWTGHLIGELGLPGNHYQQLALQDGRLGAYVAGKEFWLESAGEWRSVDWNGFLHATGWRPNYTSLLTVLENILLLAHDGHVTASEMSDGKIALETRQGQELRLISGYRMGLSLVMDKETFQVSDYTVTICGPGDSSGCFFEIMAIDGEYGTELTIPETIRQSTPSPVEWEGPEGTTTLSSGLHHTCALGVDGSPTCWGNDYHGQATPPEGERFVSIGSGETYTCGLRSDGSVVCWGSGLGDDNHYRSRDGLWTSPSDANREYGYNAKPVTIMRFTTLSVGRSKTCALRPDGSAFCWGSVDDFSPSGEVFTSISSGSGHVCGLREDGSATCWGDDHDGQAAAPEDERFVSISSGAAHTCALRASGKPVCWGNNHAGLASPPPSERLASISSGLGHVCGLRDDGTAVCWGRNAEGQSAALEGERFVSISSGGYHTCALREDGGAVCWGWNSYGQSSPPQGERFAVGPVDGT